MSRYYQNSQPTVFVEADLLQNGLVSNVVGQAVEGVSGGAQIGILNTNGTLTINGSTTCSAGQVLYRTVALPWTFAVASVASFNSNYTLADNQPIAVTH